LEIFCLSLFSLAFGGFSFFSFLFLAQLQVCIICIALAAGLAVVPTQGFHFAFVVFFFVVIFRKQYALAQRVARDKLVFGMLKHGHVSSQILTWIL